MTHRNTPTLKLLACLCAAALLTACSTGSPAAGRPNTAPPSATNSTSAPATTASPTSSATGSGVPQRPKTAAGVSLSAAESFVRYYVSLLNYASTTGDVAPMMSASAASCNQCKLYADYVAKVNAANGGLTGDYFERVDDVPDLFRGDGGRVGGYAAVTIGAYTSKDSPSAKPVTSTVRKYKREFTLLDQQGSWVMAAMRLTAQ
ncbi:DUF6318 family protein [Kribbella jiaozuonensis]|uniref:DUF6318 family protein n=1 Tax=Kribbella jiaozuonensis TaxID=2575441 RepID=UPI0022779869|nr:DUF6318 family protein [Kribbella jiaozuonensis]